MGKIETTLKAEITRLSRHETKGLISKTIIELRRLRQRVVALERELRAVKAARADIRAACGSYIAMYFDSACCRCSACLSNYYGAAI